MTIWRLWGRTHSILAESTLTGLPTGTDQFRLSSLSFSISILSHQSRYIAFASTVMIHRIFWLQSTSTISIHLVHANTSSETNVPARQLIISWMEGSGEKSTSNHRKEHSTTHVRWMEQYHPPTPFPPLSTLWIDRQRRCILRLSRTFHSQAHIIIPRDGKVQRFFFHIFHLQSTPHTYAAKLW